MIPKCAFFVTNKRDIMALFFSQQISMFLSRTEIFLKDNGTVGDMTPGASHPELVVAWLEVSRIKFHHS